MKTYRLLAFDWDGTLFDSTAIIADSIQRAAADLGLPVPSRERASHVIGLGLQDALRYAIPEVTPDLVGKIVERYRFHYLGRDQDITLFEDIPELLRELKQLGWTMTVATGKSRVGLARALAGSGLEGFFMTTRCADEGHPKPHPWMLLDTATECLVQPDEIVMIGDTTHDLDLARNAGAAFIGVGYGAHPADRLFESPSLGVATSVAQLRELLLKLPFSVV